MEMNSKPSLLELSAQMEAHAAFLKTPEGQEWKKINDSIVDYLTPITHHDPNPEHTRTMMESIKGILQNHDGPVMIPTGFKQIQDLIPTGGFKRGELMPLFVHTPPERKSDIVFHMALKMMRENPDLKIVFPVSFEWSAHDEARFKESVENMGLQYTNPSDQKETKQ